MLNQEMMLFLFLVQLIYSSALAVFKEILAPRTPLQSISAAMAGLALLFRVAHLVQIKESIQMIYTSHTSTNCLLIHARGKQANKIKTRLNLFIKMFMTLS